MIGTVTGTVTERGNGNGDGNGDGGLSRLWNLGPSLMTVHVSEPGIGFIGAFDYWRLFFA